MIMSHKQDARKNQGIKMGNKSFESVAKFRDVGTTLINGNSIHEEYKSRLNAGNAGYHSVQSPD